MKADISAMKTALVALLNDQLLEDAAAEARERADQSDATPLDRELARKLIARVEKVRNRLVLTPVEDFLGKKCLPVDWIVANLIPAHSVTLLLAPPNAGKTLLALDVAAQAAARGLRVAVVEEEGSEASLQHRLRRAFDAAGGIPPGLVSVAWNSGLSLMEPSSLAATAECVIGADLLILDSLSALSGGIDENSPKDMAQLADALHQLKSESGAAVLALHHTTKETWKPGEAPSIRATRGHGTLPARVDCIIALVPLECVSGTVAFELHCVKQRDAERGQPRRVTIAMSGPAATVEMQDLRDDALGTIPRGERRKREIALLAQAVIPFEGSGDPVSREHVVKLIGKREIDVRAAIGGLIDAGQVVEVRKGQLVRPVIRTPAESTVTDAYPSDLPGSFRKGPPFPPSHPFKGEGGDGKPSDNEKARPREDSGPFQSSRNGREETDE